MEGNALAGMVPPIFDMKGELGGINEINGCGKHRWCSVPRVCKRFPQRAK